MNFDLKKFFCLLKKFYLCISIFLALTTISVNESDADELNPEIQNSTPVQTVDSLNTDSTMQSQDVAHGDKFAHVYLFLFLIIVSAVTGRFIARKMNQPEVLGELLAGVFLGLLLMQLSSPVMTLLRHQSDVDKIVTQGIRDNSSMSDAVTRSLPPEAFTDGAYGTELLKVMTSADFPHYNLVVQALFLFSSFGVLVLLFAVGLESRLDEMLNVGGPAVTAAVIGVVVPSVLGYVTAMLMLPNHSTNYYLFVGATLCATSIGITARVLKDMGKLNIPESKIILGAAVIDDVLGLIILAVVAGIVSSGVISISTIGIILLKAILFLVAVLFVGSKFLDHQIRFASIVENKNVRLLFPFMLLFLLAWLSDLIGLASIVGAFAAGLIIKEEYFDVAGSDINSSVKSVIEPIEKIFAPVFFVIMGLQVDPSAFFNFSILGVALVLTFVAIIGKLVSGIFATGMDKKIIGIGMIPRGEVGLIFASIGKSIGVLDNQLFSGIVVVVILTTFITPPALKWAFEKQSIS